MGIDVACYRIIHMFTESYEGFKPVPENKETSYCSRLYFEVK
jgi:hypothetical protein